MTKEPHELAEAARSPRKGGSARQFLDEGFLPAFLIAASPEACPQLDDHRRALERQIVQAPDVPTVPQRQLHRATRARSRPGSLGRHKPASLEKFDSPHLDARPKRQFRFLFHALSGQKALPEQY
jgi:hypothetical protein